MKHDPDLPFDWRRKSERERFVQAVYDALEDATQESPAPSSIICTRTEMPAHRVRWALRKLIAEEAVEPYGERGNRTYVRLPWLKPEYRASARDPDIDPEARQQAREKQEKIARWRAEGCV